MAPYAPSSFDSCNTPPGNCNQEEVIFSLTERLREREAEIRQLRLEKSELENQLILRSDPSKPESAYEDLLAHLKRREEDFRSDSKKQEDTERDLVRENRRLKDKLQASRKLLDEQEKSISLLERETDDDLEIMRERLNSIMDENEEKNQQITMLEDMADGLTIEAERFKKREKEDEALLSRLGERVESYRHDQRELEVANGELQNRVDTQRQLLKEKDNKILELERYCNQRENELTDDIDRMRHQHNDFVDTQRVALEDREEEIHLLYQQCEKYENLIDEAEYVTYEQRADLKTKKREIEELSMAIEKVQNTGLLGQLDKLCSSGSTIVGTTSSNGPRR